VSENNYSIGDKVKCALNGKLRVGEIVGITSSGAQVRLSNGEQATVATAALHGLVQAAEKSMEMSREAIKDYYRKAYGYTEEDLEKLVTFIE
jgi:predicted solute-binding protein